jgi:hypothetical protein
MKGVSTIEQFHNEVLKILAPYSNTKLDNDGFEKIFVELAQTYPFFFKPIIKATPFIIESTSSPSKKGLEIKAKSEHFNVRTFILSHVANSYFVANYSEVFDEKDFNFRVSISLNTKLLDSYEVTSMDALPFYFFYQEILRYVNALEDQTGKIDIEEITFPIVKLDLNDFLQSLTEFK